MGLPSRFLSPVFLNIFHIIGAGALKVHMVIRWCLQLCLPELGLCVQSHQEGRYDYVEVSASGYHEGRDYLSGFYTDKKPALGAPLPARP